MNSPKAFQTEKNAPKAGLTVTLGKIFQTLSLFTYGNHLMLEKTRAWLLFMFLIALSIALLEGAVWTCIAEQLLPKAYSQVGCAVLGGIVLVAIYWLDNSLITTDMSEPLIKNQKKFSHFKFWGSLTVRMVMVFISIHYTAPLLGKVFLTGEIESQRLQHNNAQMQQLLANTARRYDEQGKQILADIKQAQEALQREIDGKEGSKKKGIGSSAKNRASYIAKLEASVQTLETNKKRELDAIKTMPPAELLKQYPIDYFEDTFAVRDRLYQQLSKGQTPKEEEFARLLIIALCTIMLLLKLQPNKGVKLYYNEELQACYNAYLGGKYSHLFTGKPSPFEFERVLYAFYSDAQEDDKQLKHNQALKQCAEMEEAIRELKNIMVAEQNMLATQKANLAATQAEQADLTEQLGQLEGAHQNLLAAHQANQAEQSQIEQHIKQLHLKSQAITFEIEERARLGFDGRQEQLAELAEQLKNLRADIDINRSEQGRVNSALQIKADITARLQECLNRAGLLDDAGSLQLARQLAEGFRDMEALKDRQHILLDEASRLQTSYDSLLAGQGELQQEQADATAELKNVLACFYNHQGEDIHEKIANPQHLEVIYNIEAALSQDLRQLGLARTAIEAKTDLSYTQIADNKKARSVIAARLGQLAVKVTEIDGEMAAVSNKIAAYLNKAGQLENQLLDSRCQLIGNIAPAPTPKGRP
ncbi:hypothetical protein [Methylovulum psychrotolerans]|uniref:Uncharacterized protein n=1 Tax=Methylovulum psychrotolerans TaxID=1704499 RepID=A0A1Z4BYN3_9GAMM|nr:hypothetical protein [Methylovulum psychrotolerans]ASF46398.1 hypothetical protein CEK71_10105 [Methylovulum psychrotolerans]